MTEAEIQDRADKLAAAMLGKGLKAPSASAQINSNSQPLVTCRWSDARATYGSEYSFDREDSIEEAFALAEKRIAAMPDAAERKLHEFMGALGNVIDLGRSNGIEVAFLNPLVELSKKLSENAITHRPA